MKQAPNPYVAMLNDVGFLSAQVVPDLSEEISYRLPKRLLEERERELNGYIHWLCDHIYEFPRALPIELKGIAV